MPDWLIERGIGETREVRIVEGAIWEARIHIDGTPRAGVGREAVLRSVGPPTIAWDGQREFILPKGAPGMTEGATILIETTREPIPGPEPWKRPLAKLVDGISIGLREGEILPFPSPRDRLAEAGWDDLLDEARSGTVAFPGGSLLVSPTPAMTLIDVDGTLPPADLALAGAEAAARTILRHGIGGSIGIDLPTITGKAERQAIAAAVDAILPQPFERTAVNGFGFLQIIRPRRHASLFEHALDRARFEARALLRRAAFAGPGAKRLAVHPRIAAVLGGEGAWIDALAKQVGGTIGLRVDPALAISGGHVEPA